MARDRGDAVQRALALKKTGYELLRLLGGREIHPINARVGGFYRVPSRAELAPVAEALQRARRRNAGAAADRFESERAEFFERVRLGYLARAAAEPERIAVIDATRSIDAVADEILDALRVRQWIS